MLSINLTEIQNKEEIAKIIRSEMKNNGTKKSEIILETGLSKSTVYNLLKVGKNKKDYHLSSLLKILNFLNIKMFIGKNEEVDHKVLTLF